MASATNLVLKDRNAVNVNYSPVAIETGKSAKYVDRTQSVVALQPTVRMDFSESNTLRRSTWTSVVPMARPSDPAIIDYESVKIIFTSPLAQPGTTRLESLARARALIDDAVVQAAVENGETAW